MRKRSTPGKEAARQRFLSRVRDHRYRVRRMREIAVKVGLSPAIFPQEEGAAWAIHRPYVPPPRATGRTTRMLLSAAVDVLDDHRVVYCDHAALMPTLSLIGREWSPNP